MGRVEVGGLARLGFMLLASGLVGEWGIGAGMRE